MVLARSISGVMGGSMDEHDLSKLVAGLRGVLADMADESSNGVWAWSALCDITDELDDRIGLLKKENFEPKHDPVGDHKKLLDKHGLDENMRPIRTSEVTGEHEMFNMEDIDIDVDEPDQYNVFEDQEGHNCG